MRPLLVTLPLNTQVSTCLFNQQYPGGGEGIRTPDPRVANAVLCQLSYTPEEHCQLAIADCRFLFRTTPIGNWQCEIGNEFGCGGGI
jgi:hypothetical protein